MHISGQPEDDKPPWSLGGSAAADCLTGAKTPAKDKTSPALALLLHASLKKTYYNLYPVKHMHFCIYIVSYFSADIVYDPLALFSFGFLCLNDSQRKKHRRCLMLSLSLSAWKSPSLPPNYHQMHLLI